MLSGLPQLVSASCSFSIPRHFGCIQQNIVTPILSWQQTPAFQADESREPVETGPEGTEVHHLLTSTRLRADYTNGRAKVGSLDPSR